MIYKICLERNAMPGASSVTMVVLGVLFWSGSILYKPLWKYGLTHMVTFVHELGHAIAGFLTGRGVSGIRLNFDGSGETRDSGRRAWVPGGRFISLVMGYPAPLLLGAFLIGAGVGDYINLSMKIMLGLGIFVLLFTRSLWGLLVVLVWIAFSFVASTYFYDSVISNFIITFVGAFFLVGGVKDLVLLFNQYTHGLGGETDLGIMRHESWIPMWFTFIAIIIIALPGSWLMFTLSSTLLQRLPFLSALA